MRVTHYKRKIKDNRVTRFFKAATVAARVTLIGLVVLIVLLIGVALSRYSVLQKAKAPTPTYQTLTPSQKTIQSLGGWKKLAPPKGEPFYVFTDTINGVVINVSQQQLPDSFKNDPAGQTTQLAKSYNAVSELLVGETRVYLGNSARGPQSLIFTKDSLLILIQSQNKLSDDVWTKYISELE